MEDRQPISISFHVIGRSTICVVIQGGRRFFSLLTLVFFFVLGLMPDAHTMSNKKPSE